jgi:hypothetical protein
MSGQWPPEWEDPDTGLPDEWDIDDAGLELESSALTSFLASVPSPVLPAAFEARISAAIAAEATARANGTAVGTDTADTGVGAAGPVEAKTTDRSSSLQGSSPAATESGSGATAGHRRRASASRGATRRSGPAGSRPNGRRRRLRMPSAAVGAPLLILLFIAGFAVLITQFGGGTSSSSGPDDGTSGISAGSTASAAASAHGSSAGRNAESQPASGTFRTGLAFGSLKFTVNDSGISYHRSTLASQVRTQLNAQNAVTPAAAAPSATSSNGSVVSSASATAPAPEVTAPPSVNLKGCVSTLTKGLTPSLVERATYDGIPAYIIALPSRVWVVRLGCTAADPQEITSVSLPG